MFWFAFSVAQATTEQPDELIQNLTDQVLERLQQKEQLLSDNPKQAQLITRELITEIVLPHLDMSLMSRWVIGKNWGKATPAQRKQFKDKFTSMLVRTYASAMVEFRNSHVVVKPAAYNPSKKTTVVKTEFFNGEVSPTPVLFRVRKDKQNRWKVFDMIVDGVSLVKNYKSSFSAEIRKVGIRGLLERLSSHNSMRIDA